MAFGKTLRKLLDEKGVKQNELAKKINVSESTLSSMISRDVGKVDIDLFLDICDAIDCDPNQFYREYKTTIQPRSHLSPDEQYLIDLFRQLTFKEQMKLTGRAELLVEQHREAETEDAG